MRKKYILDFFKRFQIQYTVDCCQIKTGQLLDYL